MSNNKLENIILQTIDLITTKKISNASFNKTILAKVIKCEDASIGKYKVQYQDSIFYAYTENTTISYSQGSSVYILLPNGNINGEKIILGALSTLGVNFSNVLSPQKRYNIIGNNIIEGNDSTIYQLCSYKTESQILYNRTDTVNNKFNINDKIVQEYFQNADHLILSANIQTSLPEQQHYQGNYGIILGLRFKDQSSSEQIVRYYSFDIDQMNGNPYSFETKVKQQGFFSIDSQNFIGIETISLFVKDFPNQREGEENDIFISDLSIVAAEQLSTEQLNGYSLYINTPKGYIFTYDDADSAKRTLQAQVRFNGSPITNEQIQYYWFIQNNITTAYNPYYNQYGGQGWKCLNPYNVIKEAQVENGIEQTPAVFQFIPFSNSFEIQKSDIISYYTKYKCVVVYNNNILSKQITVINLDSDYQLFLTSDSGTRFYMNTGEPTLTCYCQKKDENGEYQDVEVNKFNYVWAVVNNVGNFNSLTSNDIYSINNNQLKFKVNTISQFSFFKCSVFIKETGFFLGTATIVISNLLQEEVKNYSLVINNNDQVFKYTETGMAPTSSQLEHPQTISALSFNVYNQEGQAIDDLTLANCDITWKVPSESFTLIRPDSGYEYTEENGYRIYKNLLTFLFDINTTYDFYRTENQIELQVVYDNVRLFNKTNLIFIKQGEQGTNGTDFTCRIVPNVAGNGLSPALPILYYDGSEISFNFNTDIAGGRWFKAQLWHNGSIIYTGDTSGESIENRQPVTILNWEVLYNQYGYGSIVNTNINKKIEDKTVIKVTSNTSSSQNKYWTFSFNSDALKYNGVLLPETDWHIANIIKVTLLYGGMTYYATLPLIFSYVWNNNYRLRLKNFTGFSRVLYSSAGIHPKYDSHSPFTIETIQNDGTDISLNEDVSYQWYYMGSVFERVNSNINASNWTEIKNGNWISPVTSEHIIQSAQKNEKYVKPADSYNGECVTVGLGCKVETTDSAIGWIFIPIHMTLNTFENSAINGWDGNSVSLGNNGGMILAPQVGAGVKDGNNAFTGLFMGTAKDPQVNLSKNVSIFNSFNPLNEDVGLFGYSEGQRSIFLDAKTGKAEFGKAGAGQIIMDPSQNQAIIKSGEFIWDTDGTTGRGMEINLTAPSIRFGTGNFSVDSNGTLTAKGVNLSSSTYNNQSFDDWANSKFQENYNLTVQPLLKDLQKQVDGQIMTWYVNEDPDLNNYPYQTWAEQDISKHQGDLCYNKNTGIAYRFMNIGTVDNPIWEWTQIRDNAITEALTLSSQAKDLADGKRRIFVQQPTDADIYDEGDLWVNATYNQNGIEYKNDILRCETPKAAGAAFNIDHWKKASGYLDNYTYQPRQVMKKLVGTDVTNPNNGIWMSPTLTDNKLYINATYINTGVFTSKDKTGKEIFAIDADTGNVQIQADHFKLIGSDNQSKTIDTIIGEFTDKQLDNINETLADLRELGYGTCDTSASTQVKIVQVNSSSVPVRGTKISVFFFNGNTAGSPKIKLQNGDTVLTEAQPIRVRATSVQGMSNFKWNAEILLDLVYIGGAWRLGSETAEEFFNRLTKNASNQGIFLENGNVYINASYINTGALKVSKKIGNKTENTFYANTANGTVDIIANSFRLISASKQVVTVPTLINSIKASGKNLLRGTNTYRSYKVFTSTSAGTWGKSTWKKIGNKVAYCEYTKDVLNFPSGEITVCWCLKAKASNTPAVGIQQDNVPVNVNKTYVLSCYYIGGGQLGLRYGYQKTKLTKKSFKTSATKWTRVYIRFKLTSDYIKSGKTNIAFENTGNKDLHICGMQLVESNLLSDWTESPQDLKSQFKSSIDKNTIVKRLAAKEEPDAIVLKDGKLNISASLLKAGIIEAKKKVKGSNKETVVSSWNLTDGVFVNGTNKKNIRISDGCFNIKYNNNSLATFQSGYYSKYESYATSIKLGEKCDIFTIEGLNDNKHMDPIMSIITNTSKMAVKKYGSKHSINFYQNVDMHHGVIKDPVFWFQNVDKPGKYFKGVSGRITMIPIQAITKSGLVDSWASKAQSFIWQNGVLVGVRNATKEEIADWAGDV